MKYRVGTLLWNNLFGLGMIREIVYKSSGRLYVVHYFSTERSDTLPVYTVEDMVKIYRSKTVRR